MSLNYYCRKACFFLSSFVFFLLDLKFRMAGGSCHANNSGITESTLLLNNSNSLSPSYKRRTRSYVNTNRSYVNTNSAAKPVLRSVSGLTPWKRGKKDGNV